MGKMEALEVEKKLNKEKHLVGTGGKEGPSFKTSHDTLPH